MHLRHFYLRREFMKKIFVSLALMAACSLHAQIQLLTPSSADTVIEKLGPRLVKTPVSGDVIPAVRQAISLARQSSDPRYLGQAQALIGSQWNSPQAPHDLLTLQATIEQSRHEFEQASKTLRLALQRPAPSKAQAWLTLATIERVQGRYAASMKACNSITEPPAQLYARACALETLSMQGQWASAREGLAQLLSEQRLPVQQAWLQSLQAENELRAGDRAAALKYFSISLSLADDGYTALAYADTLLDEGQAQAVLRVLEAQPSSDSVLIRRARAYKLLNNPQAEVLVRELSSRFATLLQRGGMLGHAREQALFEGYVVGDSSAALAAAKENLKLQRESIDWLIAIRSAQAAGQSGEKTRLLRELAETGLKDARLQ